MKKLCCIPCAETPNINVSLHCLSACCESKTEKKSGTIEISKTQLCPDRKKDDLKQSSSTTSRFGENERSVENNLL